MTKNLHEEDFDDKWIVTDLGFYERLKPLRNKLRKYSSESVLKACMEKMNKFGFDSMEGMMAMPWLWIVVIKWKFIDEADAALGKKIMTQTDLEGLQDLLVKISNYTKLPTQYKPMELWTRTVTYQQTPYQTPVAINSLARQDLIFGGSQENDFFQTEFYKMHKVSLGVFLRISAFLLSHIEINNNLIFSLHDLPIKIFGKEVLAAYLNSISISIEDLGTALTQASPGRRKAKEFFEQTPFLSFPIVRVKDAYWCVNKKILSSCLDTFVYDTLKGQKKFSDKFGKKFEGYVESIISQSGLGYKTESELKRLLGNESKVVDFLVVSEGANFFIDAKGVDLAARAKLTHLSDVLKGAIKDSLLKAVEQGQATNLGLPLVGSPDSFDTIIRKRALNYLIAVTYKPLFIGNAEFLNHLIGGDEVGRILQGYPVESQIPLENIYFVSVGEFESLINLVKEGRLGLAQAIERAKLADSEFETAKYYFAAHLSEWPEYHDLDSLLQPKVEAMTCEFKSDSERSSPA